LRSGYLAHYAVGLESKTCRPTDDRVDRCGELLSRSPEESLFRPKSGRADAADNAPPAGIFQVGVGVKCDPVATRVGPSRLMRGTDAGAVVSWKSRRTGLSPVRIGLEFFACRRPSSPRKVLPTPGDLLADLKKVHLHARSGRALTVNVLP
jgi:hypothetical protein